MRRDSFAGFASVRGSDIVGRLAGFEAWVAGRIEDQSWSFGRVSRPAPSSLPPGLVVAVKSASGRETVGYNFASQDYLGLTTHPGVRAFVSGVLDEYGPHSAGSDPNLGNHPVSELLKAELGQFLGREHVVLFPTGWSAAYGALRSVARPRDHVVLDRLAHNCLVSGARAATANVSFFEHNEVLDLRARLATIREADRENAVLVVSESLFSMDADSPNLEGLVRTCRDFDAHLVLDVAHDLGAAGLDGLGLLAAAGLSPSDIIVGTFSKTFCTTGGFMATTNSGLATYVRAFGDANTFSNTLSPIAAAAALGALRVVRSEEGAQRRCQLSAVSMRLRAALGSHGLVCMGSPAAVVPVLVGDERAGRRACSDLDVAGVVSNFMEFPAVPLGRSRLRLQVSPAHGLLPIEDCAQTIANAIQSALTGEDMAGLTMGAAGAHRVARAV